MQNQLAPQVRFSLKTAGQAENFATFGGLKNLKEHGVIMLGQTAKLIAKQQPSPAAVAAFYTTIAAIATLGLVILTVSANVAYLVAH